VPDGMLVVSFTLPARGHRESNFCAFAKKKTALKNRINNRIAWFFFGRIVQKDKRNQRQTELVK
jgi:hypothetical protein